MQAQEHALQVIVAQHEPKRLPQHVIAAVIGAEMMPPMGKRMGACRR